MKRGFVIILLLLSACATVEQGRSYEIPVAEWPPVEQPAPLPAPSPNKACLKECSNELQKCNSVHNPQFSVCVDRARADLKNCLGAGGDDAYCRLAYSKTRTICYNSFMAKCDIFFNNCRSEC